MLHPHPQLNKRDQAIDDCTSAIKLDETYIKAYLRRAQWYVVHFKYNINIKCRLPVFVVCHFLVTLCVLQLHGHWAIRGGSARLRKGLPDRKNIRSVLWSTVFFQRLHRFSVSLSFITLDHKQLLKRAQLELKKSKRKDYYKVLGVGKNATEDEIKKAYRKRALLHHPGQP